MKILVIRLSSLGDVLLATPVVRCLKSQIDDCQVHFLTKASNAALLKDSPYIDRLILWNGDTRETIRTMVDEEYDYVVDLHNRRRTRYIRRSITGRKLVYKKESWRKLLYILTRIDLLHGRHVVDRYMDTLEPLGIRNDGGGLDVFVSKEIDMTLEKPKGRYVVVACGAQHGTKRIPPERLYELVGMINREVILVGDEADRLRIVESGVGFGEGVRNMCGRTKIEELVALIQDADLVITPDSMTMHMAAALKRPVVAIWGATTPKFGFSAYCTTHVDYEREHLWCHPCSRTGFEHCPLGHFRCMNGHDWRSIAEKVNQIEK